MKTIFTVFAFIFAFLSTAQDTCNYPVDTTATVIDFSLNLNSVDLLASNTCTAPIQLLPEGDTTYHYVGFLITSNMMVLDYNHVPLSNPACPDFLQNLWRVYSCDFSVQYDPTPSGDWIMPYTDSVPGIGWKHFIFPDSMIGKYAIAERRIMSLNDTASCEFQPCVGLYAVGTEYLGLFNPDTNLSVGNAYPNPTDGQVNFEVPTSLLLKVTIYSYSGGKIGEAFSYPNESIFTYDTKFLSKGNYIFFFEGGNDRVSRKVVIQ